MVLIAVILSLHIEGQISPDKRAWSRRPLCRFKSANVVSEGLAANSASATDDDSVRATMTGANASGHGAEDPGKRLLYCYGCGRGGDVFPFAELYHQVKSRKLWRATTGPSHDGEAIAYLNQRGVRSPELIEHMRIHCRSRLAHRPRRSSPDCSRVSADLLAACTDGHRKATAGLE
jgi:hypothetical protein